ncbi:MAG: HEPN domain-containing protein [FCB group bacterium]|jgi:uncharacterized protein (UPF0332 family)
MIDLIKYRIDKSKQTFEDAIYNYDGQKYSTCLNRLYYSAYYAVTALLLSKNLSAKTHKGVRQLFNQYFIKEELISEEESILFTQLFDLRQESDYEDFSEIDYSIIPELIQKTKSFISTINGLII